MVTLRPYQFIDPDYDVNVIVPSLFTTDFNSVPSRLLWVLFAPTEFPGAAVMHDWVFRHPPEGWSRENCDWLHWRLLRMLGCPKWKAEAIFQAVSRGSKRAWNKHRQRERYGDAG